MTEPTSDERYMTKDNWAGVFPAVTTPFRQDFSVDGEALHRHVSWLVGAGCQGIVALGSLGEGVSLRENEKIAVLNICRHAIAKRVPLVGGVAGVGTSECVARAQAMYAAGCDALMVLPPLVYDCDPREAVAHLDALISATPLPCLLYNNPIAYGTDVTPEQIELLARHDNLQALKESSGDVRRVTAIRGRLGDRLAILAGLDDAIVESIAAGAVGWVAGLVNALPDETLRLFALARAGRVEEAHELYEWFLPLLRLDTKPKFVQLIKLVQAELGRGSARCRPPRLELVGAELDEAQQLIRDSLAQKVA